jgi:uncharacterized protein (TIGR03067 family)
MRVRVLSAVLALVGAALASAFPPVPPPKAKKVKEEKLSVKALEGTWTVSSYEYRSARGISTNILYPTIEIKDGKWVQKRELNGRPISLSPYTIKIDAKQTPQHFDMSLANSKVTATARKGLFRLDGDRLTVTYTLGNKDRPSSVDGGLEVSQYRWVLKRQKP